MFLFAGPSRMQRGMHSVFHLYTWAPTSVCILHRLPPSDKKQILSTLEVLFNGVFAFFGWRYRCFLYVCLSTGVKIPGFKFGFGTRKENRAFSISATREIHSCVRGPLVIYYSALTFFVRAILVAFFFWWVKIWKGGLFDIVHLTHGLPHILLHIPHTVERAMCQNTFLSQKPTPGDTLHFFVEVAIEINLHI